MSVVEESLKNGLDSIYFYPDKSKIVMWNGISVGFYTPLILFKQLVVEYSLDRKFQGQGYGTKFVEFVTRLVGQEYYMYDKIFLLIKYTNVLSRLVAERNGYEKYFDEDVLAMIHAELPNYYLYYKENCFYQKCENEKKLLHKV